LAATLSRAIVLFDGAAWSVIVGACRHRDHPAMPDSE